MNDTTTITTLHDQRRGMASARKLAANAVRDAGQTYKAAMHAGAPTPDVLRLAREYRARRDEAAALEAEWNECLIELDAAIAQAVA